MLDDELRAALWAIQRQLPGWADADYQKWAVNREPEMSEVLHIRNKTVHLPRERRVALAISDVGRDQDILASLYSIAEQIVPPSEVVLLLQDEARAAWASQHVAGVLENITAYTLLVVDADESELDAANRVFQVLQSDYVGWVSAGDRLATVAIATMLKAIADFPDAKIIYSDEDWVDDRGVRMRPRFKTAWDPDAQLGMDLLGRLCLLDVKAVRQAGGFRRQFGIAAHYDLHCRVALPLLDSAIRHVPAVLYHRRIVLGQDALCTTHPMEAYLEALRAAAGEAVTKLIGKAARVFPSPIAPFVNRIGWPLPAQLPKVSILIPTRDRADLVDNCVRGLLCRTDYPNIEVLVLDNDSVQPVTHAIFRHLRRDQRVRVIPMPGPFNYSHINNQGARLASGDILVLMNNDVEVIHHGWLKEMVAQVVRPDIGCVGIKLLFGDKRIQHAGVLLQKGPLAMHAFRLRGPWDLGEDGQLAGVRSYLAVTAACLAIRRTVFEEVAGFDAKNLQIAYNDVDLCLRVHDAGYRNVCVPFHPLYHLESASRGANDSPEKRIKDRAELEHAANRWRDKFERDPYVNPQIWYTWDHGASLARRDILTDLISSAR